MTPPMNRDKLMVLAIIYFLALPTIGIVAIAASWLP